MLKGIPSLLTPELLKFLCEMGHRDELLITDRNFPANSNGRNVVRLDGHLAPAVLRAVLSLTPLDDGPHPVTLERTVQGGDAPIWKEYKKAIGEYDGRADSCIQLVSHDDFYAKVRSCYLIISTGDPALYGNIILKKGLIMD